jgi:hypothetical protein
MLLPYESLTTIVSLHISINQKLAHHVRLGSQDARWMAIVRTSADSSVVVVRLPTCAGESRRGVGIGGGE